MYLKHTMKPVMSGSARPECEMALYMGAAMAVVMPFGFMLGMYTNKKPISQFSLRIAVLVFSASLYLRAQPPQGHDRRPGLDGRR